MLRTVSAGLWAVDAGIFVDIDGGGGGRRGGGSGEPRFLPARSTSGLVGDGLTKSDEIPSETSARSEVPSSVHTHALPTGVPLEGVLPCLIDDLNGELIIAGERRRRRMLLRRTLPGVLRILGGSDAFRRRSVSAGDLSRLPLPMSRATGCGGLLGVCPGSVGPGLGESRYICVWDMFAAQ